MKWTNELPKEPGWYAWRIGKGHSPSFIYLIWGVGVGKNTEKKLLVMYPAFSTLTQTPEDIGGQWAGPIEEPEEEHDNHTSNQQLSQDCMAVFMA